MDCFHFKFCQSHVCLLFREAISSCAILYFSFPAQFYFSPRASNYLVLLFVCLSINLSLIWLQSPCRLSMSSKISRFSHASGTLINFTVLNDLSRIFWAGILRKTVPCFWPPSHSGVFLYYHPRDVLPISPVSEFPVFSVYFGIQLCFGISSNNFSKGSMRSKHFAFLKITLDYLIEYGIQSWIFF